jgi:acetyl esterase/lipase
MNPLKFHVNACFAWMVLVMSGQLIVHDSAGADVEKLADTFMKSYLFEDFALSPDGSHLSMILHKNSGDVMATLDLSTGNAKSASGSPGQRIYDYSWVDGDHVAFQVGLWDYYNAGLYVADEDLRTFRMIGTPNPVPEMRMILSEELLFLKDPLPQVPGKMLISDRTVKQQFPDAYLYNHVDDTIDMSLTNTDQVTSWIFDMEGELRLMRKLTSPGDTELFHRGSDEADWSLVPLPEENLVLGFDRTGDRLYMSYPDEEGQVCFQLFDLNKMTFVGNPVRHPVFSARPRLLRDGPTGAMVGVVYNWDKPKVVYFDSAYKSIQKEVEKLFPGSVCSVVGQTKKGSVIIEVSSDIHPSRIFELELPDMKLAKLLDQADWITDDMCQPMETIAFPARDGVTVHGYLTRSRIDPEATGPTVMLVHGGPYRRDSWGFDPKVQFLSNLGYHVVQVNFRGSSGFNEDYSIKELRRICEFAVSDVADGARWAIAEGIADPSRIAVYGASFGGYAALSGAAFEPDLYKVAIGFAGVYDFDRQLKNTYKGKGSMRDWLEPFLGDIDEDPEAYRKLSPLHFADKIRAKVMLVHGGADSIVPVSQSRRMARALRKAGNDPVLETTTWGIHGFADEKKRIEFAELIGNFLKEQL